MDKYTILMDMKTQFEKTDFILFFYKWPLLFTMGSGRGGDTRALAPGAAPKACHHPQEAGKLFLKV